MGFLPRFRRGRERGRGADSPRTSRAATGPLSAVAAASTPRGSQRRPSHRRPNAEQRATNPIPPATTHGADISSHTSPDRPIPARLTMWEYRRSGYGRGWTTGIRRECSYGYTDRCMFAIGQVDTFSSTPLFPRWGEHAGGGFRYVSLPRVTSGTLSIARFTFTSGESAEFLSPVDSDFEAEPVVEGHEPSPGGNAQDAPIGIAADWLTGVWQQCTARSPALPQSPDGK